MSEIPKSYKPQVFVQGEWSLNALRFATEDEARAYACDLFSRWTLCSDYRAVPSEDEPTHVWDKDRGLANVGSDEFRFPARSVSL